MESLPPLPASWWGAYDCWTWISIIACRNNRIIWEVLNTRIFVYTFVIFIIVLYMIWFLALSVNTHELKDFNYNFQTLENNILQWVFEHDTNFIILSLQIKIRFSCIYYSKKWNPVRVLRAPINQMAYENN